MNNNEKAAIVGYWRMCENIPLVAECIGFTEGVKNFVNQRKMPTNMQITKFREKLVTDFLIDKKIIQNYARK
jgi:hypothetical protein